jgi:integrase
MSLSSALSAPASRRVPSYRHHKPSGQAVVTVNGRDIYLGEYRSKESRAQYDRLIAEWLAAGRCLPGVDTDLTIAELALRYWRFAKGYYVKNGEPTGWQTHIKLVLRLLTQPYGPTLAADFGPLALKAFRQRLIEAGHSRMYINKLAAIIPRMFKWAASEQLVPGAVYHDLRTVEGLRKGRCEAPDHAPVAPVSDFAAQATLPHLPVIVADMVRFQRLTGCRPAEVCILRPCDLDTSGEVWSYRPESHKTEHRGRERLIFVGPKAQDVLRPYLLREKTSYCFVPAESEKKRRAEVHVRRRTPLSCGNRPGTNRRGRPKRFPGDRYTTASYRRAIDRAVKLANRKGAQEAEARGEEPSAPLPLWSPNQLRHSAATEIRRRFGLEAAQVTLGHASADVSQIYAERDWSLAAEVMRKIG